MPRLFGLLLGISLLYPGFLAAQDTVKVMGMVKQLDIETGTITIRPTRKFATEDEKFNLLKKDIVVTTAAGEKSRLEAVGPGHTVQLRLGASGDVESIVVQPYVFLATVVSVDNQKRTIALTHEGDKTTTLAVAADVKVVLGERSAFLREVKVGSQMKVSASLDGKTVVAMNLVSDPDGKLATKLFPRVKASRLPGSRWIGVVTEVDAAKSELHVNGPKTKGVSKPMPITRDALIQVIYGEVPMQNISLQQVVKEARGTFMVSAEDQITRVLVRPPVVIGKIKTLDADAGELTVEVNGNEKTYVLPEDIKVMYGSRVRRLSDLQPNQEVSLVLSLGQERLLAVDLRPLAQ